MDKEALLKELLASPEFEAAVDARVMKGAAEAVALATKISARDVNATLQSLRRPALSEPRPGSFRA